jgi:methylated-DNA-[protein]-cysteine S-methyltransferase
MSAFTLFDTPIGRCGIAWEGDVIVGVRLPEARFDGSGPGPPPPWVQRTIDDIVASLRGEADDLADIPLDLDRLAPFQRRVYEVVRTIPAGETMSYGEVAAAAGSPGAARAVGQALGRNPFAIVVPCHRVLAAGGKTGGFTAQGGVTTKLRMLAIEGVRPADGR